mgnify:CR=1 FL=1
MFTPKLIASDLDGTLLQDHVRRIDEQTLKLIENCLDAGISFAAASGVSIRTCAISLLLWQTALTMSARMAALSLRGTS